MNKTTAKKPAAKTAAKKPAAKSAVPAKKAAVKAAPAKKAAAKAAPAKKPAAKAAAPAKSAGAAHHASHPATHAAAHKPTARHAPEQPVHAPAHAAKVDHNPHAPAHAAHAAPARPPAAAPAGGSKAVAHPPVAAAAAPAATATVSPQANRFADRFSPAKPVNRTMNHVITESPKQVHKADPKLANAWKSKAGRDLTEDELLAMPDSEYMNDKQLEFFRAKLTALKDDLLSNAGETTEHLREDTSIVPDPADRATIEEEHALELRTRDRERKLLKKIGQSLARIDAGDYGFCDETGEPIGLGRLIARPTATLSLEAQQRRELKQKMFGD